MYKIVKLTAVSKRTAINPDYQPKDYVYVDGQEYDRELAGTAADERDAQLRVDNLRVQQPVDGVMYYYARIP